MINLDAAKKERIALIRSDIRSTVSKRLAFGIPFTDDQIVALDCFFDYFIDCIAELELKVEMLEAGGGSPTTVVVREVGSSDSDHSAGWDTPVMGRFRD